MRAKQIKIKKEVSVLYIHPKSVDEYWNLCEFNLKEGLKYDGDPMSILELMFGADDGEKYKVFGVYVTRVTKLPNYNQMEVILLKGEKRELWQDEAAEMIENFAIQHDCKKIAVHARPGWLKFLGEKNWKVKRYLYTKELI